MNNPKNAPIVQIVAGIFVIASGIVFAWMPSLNPSDSSLATVGLIFGIALPIMGVIAIIVGAFGIAKKSNGKKRMRDPSTLAGQTYGNAGNYAQFSALMNKDMQDAANVAMNVIGAVSFLAGGVGVFGRSYNFTDVFVSPEEIIANNMTKNIGLDDKKFIRIPLDEVLEISAVIKNYANIKIVCAQKTHYMAIVNSSWTNEQICNFFCTLKIGGQQQQQQAAMPNSEPF